MYVDTKLHKVAPRSPYRTRQELFNNAYWGIASQGWVRSWDEDGQMCMYRARTDGLRCAIGWNIPSPMYDDAMEGQTCTAPIVVNAARIDPRRDGAFARALQDAHDDLSNTRPDMQERLEAFAHAWNLHVPAFHAEFCNAGA